MGWLFIAVFRSVGRLFDSIPGPIYVRTTLAGLGPGVRCVDETTYCIDGIKYWLWVATSDRVCVLLLAPTGSSAELKQLSGENFEGILSSDCRACLQPARQQQPNRNV